MLLKMQTGHVVEGKNGARTTYHVGRVFDLPEKLGLELAGRFPPVAWPDGMDLPQTEEGHKEALVKVPAASKRPTKTKKTANPKKTEGSK